MDQLLTDSFESLIADICPPAQIRRVEAGESAAAIWSQACDSGFADALVPASADGAGLGWHDCAGIVFACGRHAFPLPLPHTMLARAHAAIAGVMLPAGPITFADRTRAEPGGAIVANAVPFGLVAEWVWLQLDDAHWLLPVTSASRCRSGGHGSLTADISWAERPLDALPLNVDGTFSLRAAGAAITAALMAGAMERVCDMSITYANERVQFGKPIGKLQAIQQQLSQASEHMFASRSAALLALSDPAFGLEAVRAAVAKSRTGEAATVVAAIGHAVHGAIGITEEYDLQLFSRRLYEWRRDFGSETYWHIELGRSLLSGTETPLDFVRNQIAS